MMFMPSMLLFVLVLLLSVFIIISSPSWLGAWVGLEVNLISFIPIILTRGVVTSVESCIKYFLVQAFSSLLLIISILLIMLGGVSLDWFLHLTSRRLLIVALLIKLGAAPFHFWFPSVSSGIGWLQNFILITWQKIGPLILLTYVLGLGPILIIVVVITTYVGGVGGLNQSSLRKLMAYSSINHLGWLIISSYFGIKFLTIYFFIYMATNICLVMVINIGGFYYLSQMYYYRGSRGNIFVILVNWLSFGGLPPFIGFFGKWIVINLMVDGGLPVLCVVILIISLLSLYYYVRICYTILRQSSRLVLVSGLTPNITWNLSFTVIRLVIRLMLTPIFVTWF